METKGIVGAVDIRTTNLNGTQGKGIGGTTGLETGQTLVEIDPRYFRPTEVEHLHADISKARRLLNWEPRVTFDELVEVMMDYDLKLAGVEPPGHGITACQDKGFCYTDHSFATNERIGESV